MSKPTTDETTRAEALAEEAGTLLAGAEDEQQEIRAAETLQAFRLGWKAHEQSQGNQAPAGRTPA